MESIKLKKLGPDLKELEEKLKNKEIDNIEFNKIIKEKGLQTDYKSVITMIINSPPREGLSISDMRKRIKILDLLEKSDEILEIEDEYYKLLQGLVKNFKWMQIDKNIIEFCSDFEC